MECSKNTVYTLFQSQMTIEKSNESFMVHGLIVTKPSKKEKQVVYVKGFILEDKLGDIQDQVIKTKFVKEHMPKIFEEHLNELYWWVVDMNENENGQLMSTIEEKNIPLILLKSYPKDKTYIIQMNECDAISYFVKWLKRYEKFKTKYNNLSEILDNPSATQCRVEYPISKGIHGFQTEMPLMKNSIWQRLPVFIRNGVNWNYTDEYKHPDQRKGISFCKTWYNMADSITYGGVKYAVKEVLENVTKDPPTDYSFLAWGNSPYLGPKYFKLIDTDQRNFVVFVPFDIKMWKELEEKPFVVWPNDVFNVGPI